MLLDNAAKTLSWLRVLFISGARVWPRANAVNWEKRSGKSCRLAGRAGGRRLAGWAARRPAVSRRGRPGRPRFPAWKAGFRAGIPRLPSGNRRFRAFGRGFPAGNLRFPAGIWRSAGRRRGFPARKWPIRAGKACFPAARRGFPASGRDRVQEIAVFLLETGPCEHEIPAFRFAGGGFHNFS